MILAIDTATSQALLALGSAAGALTAVRGWAVGYRHGETLLSELTGFLAEARIGLTDLTGLVVGTGPGAFTGLRVGLATAKALAHELAVPIAGVSTAEAWLEAAARDEAEADQAAGDAASSLVLLLPAGPNDRVLVRPGGSPQLIAGGTEPDFTAGERLVAIDLEGRAPDAAIARGERLRGERIAAALLRLGAARLADGTGDDLARLVPEYVTLPRGVRAPSGEVEWSRDLR
jgi:tRNA threonylcarbamoyl adenosine modification protein YeaZ